MNLTEREKEVLQAMQQGHKTDKQIGKALGLSPRTVEHYLKNARMRMGADDRESALLAFTRSQS